MSRNTFLVAIILMVSCVTLFSQEIWSPEVNLTNNSYSQTTRAATTNTRSLVIDSQNNFYVAWMDNRNGNSDIYFRSYTINGWQAEQKVNFTSGSQALLGNPICASSACVSLPNAERGSEKNGQVRSGAWERDEQRCFLDSRFSQGDAFGTRE